MVSFVAAWICMLLAGSTIVVQHVVQPRLPVYHLTIQNIIPMMRRIRLTTNVAFFNDNYLSIHVHALSFDLFYMDWNDSLVHIGTVHDKQQAQQQQQQQQAVDEEKVSHRSPSTAPVLWKIPPRADFATTDDIYLAPYIGSVIRTIAQLAFAIYKGGGRVMVPSTGVAHIKASRGAAPFTVSIVCDNMLDTWNMQIIGLECALRELKPGWLDLNVAVERLRGHALDTLRPGSNGGGFLPHAKNVTFSALMNRIAWEEALQHL
jgi:hypothetical protein